MCIMVVPTAALVAKQVVNDNISVESEYGAPRPSARLELNVVQTRSV